MCGFAIDIFVPGDHTIVIPMHQSRPESILGGSVFRLHIVHHRHSLTLLIEGVGVLLADEWSLAVEAVRRMVFLKGP